MKRPAGERAVSGRRDAAVLRVIHHDAQVQRVILTMLITRGSMEQGLRIAIPQCIVCIVHSCLPDGESHFREGRRSAAYFCRCARRFTCSGRFWPIRPRNAWLLRDRYRAREMSKRLRLDTLLAERGFFPSAQPCRRVGDGRGGLLRTAGLGTHPHSRRPPARPPRRAGAGQLSRASWSMSRCR